MSSLNRNLTNATVTTEIKDMGYRWAERLFLAEIFITLYMSSLCYPTSKTEIKMIGHHANFCATLMSLSHILALCQ